MIEYPYIRLDPNISYLSSLSLPFCDFFQHLDFQHSWYHPEIYIRFERAPRLLALKFLDVHAASHSGALFCPDPEVHGISTQCKPLIHEIALAASRGLNNPVLF
jgi:hypothetical protein